MNRSTADSTLDDDTARLTFGAGLPRRAPPTNHSTRSTADDAGDHARAAGRPPAPTRTVRCWRSRRPRTAPPSCPSHANSSTATSTTNERWIPSCRPSAIGGTIDIAMQRPDEEAAERQRPDREALPVPGDRVRDDDHEQYEVDHGAPSASAGTG